MRNFAFWAEDSRIASSFKVQLGVTVHLTLNKNKNNNVFWKYIKIQQFNSIQFNTTASKDNKTMIYKVTSIFGVLQRLLSLSHKKKLRL